MKTVYLQPKSSTGSTMEEDRFEHRDNSSYFPGCRKDANCNCEICLASISATLDLMPASFQKSSLTKLSVSRPKNVESTPISFDASILSTPSSSSCRISSSPVVKSNAKSNLQQKMEKKKKGWGLCGKVFSLMLGLSLILTADFALSGAVSAMFPPVLSPELVKNISEKSWAVNGLKGKLRFLQSEMRSIVKQEISNCSHADSVWEIIQDDLLLNSRCILYKSAIEEVTIWGWPLQTAGLLRNGFSLRAFAILSGRVTEWSGGSIGYSIRKANTNTSWVQPKWGASLVQLDPNTWILEYRRSSICDNSRLHSAALEFLKHKVSRVAARLKVSWLFAPFEDYQYSRLTVNYGAKVPT
ncbi:hypothetical protein L6164_025687 [Bauhinia variegata]|uniref:Uncharacterized protein n=1 Tax=Bauhinia variegata TaxID=167791 RepID=A0ACB9M1N8_BAUVA|nr:hypothetical protein L6164_025687 [Bauhinia variegata]